MPPRRVKKAPKATLNAPRDNEPIYSPSPTPDEPEPTIEPTIDELTTMLTTEPTTDLTTDPTIELMTKLTTDLTTGPTNDANKLLLPQQEKAAALKWTTEMIEALVECIYGVWKDGRAADNGFKKEAWVEASKAVKRVYQGPLAIK